MGNLFLAVDTNSHADTKQMPMLGKGNGTCRTACFLNGVSFRVFKRTNPLRRARWYYHDVKIMTLGKDARLMPPFRALPNQAYKDPSVTFKRAVHQTARSLPHRKCRLKRYDRELWRCEC